MSLKKIIKEVLKEQMDKPLKKMKKHSKRYDTIWQLMNCGDYLLEKGHTLYGTWYKCIAGALYIEFLFKNEVELAGKHIGKNLPELPNSYYGDNSILKWAEKTYDVNHLLRNMVESIDNVEEVREFLKKHNKSLSNLLIKTQPTFTFKVDVMEQEQAEQHDFLVYYSIIDDKTGKRDTKNLQKKIIKATSARQAKKIAIEQLKKSWMAGVMKPQIVDVTRKQ